MKILFISIEPPYPTTKGQRLRNWAILSALATHGHRTTLLSFGAPDADEGLSEVRRICEEVEYIAQPEAAANKFSKLQRLRTLVGRIPHGAWKYRSEPMRERVAAHLNTGKFDLVVCNEIYVYVNLAQPNPLPLWLDKMDVTHLILKRYLGLERNPALRVYGAIEHAKMEAWERAACAAAAHVTACSAVDAEGLRALCPQAEISVVPNVIDTGRYYLGGAGEPNTLLYCGAVDWYPNQDAVEFYLSQIQPIVRRTLPEARLIVTGNKPSDHLCSRIDPQRQAEFTGRVPDVRVEIARTALSIVPLRIGSGTRLKILEAAAMGKAVVATTLGAEGLDFTPGEEIEIADSPEGFARAVTGLLANPERREKMGLAARAKVRALYSQTAADAAVEKALEAIGRRKMAPALSFR